MRRVAAAALLSLASCHAGLGADARTGPPPDERAAEIALNDALLCVRDGGRVRCGEISDVTRPLAGGPALAGVDVLDLALGDRFGCVVARGGGVLCFGANEYGELGARSRAERSDVPLPVAGLSGARRVFAGPGHACAIVDDGRVYCWGDNRAGQVGAPVHYEPEARELVAPFEVAGARGASTLALGRSLSCALDAGGAMACWGTPPESGTLPPAERALEAPSPLRGFPRFFDDLTAASHGFCGLRRGELFCWGDGLSLFGDDGPLRPPRPRAQGLARVRRAAARDLYACALHDGGLVSCWSRGLVGGGDGSVDVKTFGPQTVRGLPAAIDVAVHDDRACALTAEREAYCWEASPWARPLAGGRRRGPQRVRVF